MSAAATTVAPVVASLFGFGVGVVRSIVESVLGQLTSWVASGAGDVLGALGSLLTATTTPVLGRGFLGEYAAMTGVSAVLCLPLLLCAVIGSVARQDLGGLVRSVLLRLPVALLFAGAAVGVVSLGLELADEVSGALLAVAGHPVDGFIGALVTDIALASSATPGGPAVGGFAALAIALLATAVAFLLWVELAVRSAAVAAATLFVPLALAGLVWPATAHWARRLGETIAALVLAKVVVAGVLALAGTTIVEGEGASGAVEGIALLLLATLAPFAVLRLLPFVEGGATGHLEGLGRRGVLAAAALPGQAAAAGEFVAERAAAWAGRTRPGTGTGAAGAPVTVVDGPPGVQIVELPSADGRGRSSGRAGAGDGDNGDSGSRGGPR